MPIRVVRWVQFEALGDIGGCLFPLGLLGFESAAARPGERIAWVGCDEAVEIPEGAGWLASFRSRPRQRPASIVTRSPAGRAQSAAKRYGGQFQLILLEVRPRAQQKASASWG